MRDQGELRRSMNATGAAGSIFKVLDGRGRIPARRPVWAGFIVLSLTLFLGSLLWYSYPDEAQKREIMAVPIIHAAVGPIKITPNDPGGMDIPYRDSTIFEVLHAGGKGDTHVVENLLSDPEIPVAREQIFSKLKAEIKVEGHKIAKVGKKSKSFTAKPVFVSENVMGSVPVPQEKPMLILAKKISRTEPAAGIETFRGTRAKETHDEVYNYDGYFVQLASLRSDASARTVWKDLQKSLFVLRPLNHRIHKVSLGARGNYYRVQAGPLKEAQAREICVAVEAQRPGGCLVVKN